MVAKDDDTFIPIGTSIVKLLLIASGQGTLAAAVGEGAGLLAKLRGALEIRGTRVGLVEKIADDAAKQLLREHEGISKADWHWSPRLSTDFRRKNGLPRDTTGKSCTKLFLTWVEQACAESWRMSRPSRPSTGYLRWPVRGLLIILRNPRRLSRS